MYHQLIGNLVYFCLTRPDITHAVSIISPFVFTPHSAHYSALLRILRYLRGTITRSLLMSSTSSLELWAYSDADWASCPYTRRFTTDFCLFLGTSLISWWNKKQDVISCSSCEDEFRAMSTTTREIVHVRRLLEDFGVLLRILGYLKGTITLSLFMSSTSSLEFRAYSDAHWADCPYTRHSITGFCLLLGGSLISWQSKK